jgi:hypothetical protein
MQIDTTPVPELKPTLNPNVEFVFTEYTIRDGEIVLFFVCTNPGPGMISNYSVVVTDTELSNISTQAQFLNLVTTKLQRKYRGSNIATKLDSFIGRSVTI